MRLYTLAQVQGTHFRLGLLRLYQKFGLLVVYWGSYKTTTKLFVSLCSSLVLLGSFFNSKDRLSFHGYAERTKKPPLTVAC